ncbi:LAETG motif-containing sortase-dependent surface protein [Streptomyces sp. FR-108]|uniref:LAETG motif-containing sortase-dependent surface protein n=1 Tax=Streptomyces sp. FR-108 TaxID=3416665 RepID=UPI003CED73D0
MNLFRKSASLAVAALALAALSATTAEAHDGLHPFQNCTEAYENGYANIVKGDDHYAEDLDRDKDGIGCDKPPADFVPAKDTEDQDTEDQDTDGEDAGKQGTGPQNPDLAETGGSGATPYLAGGGAAVLLAGGGVLFTLRRRRDAR